MLAFLRKLFGSGAPVPVAQNSARQDDEISALHEEFCRTFCHKPGVNFMAFLEAEGVTRMIDWLSPSTRCALPKGFMSFAVNSTRQGQNIWDMPGVSMLYEGNWDNGGTPPQPSLDAVSVLAQILGKPIKIFYTVKQGGEYMVMVLEP